MCLYKIDCGEMVNKRIIKTFFIMTLGVIFLKFIPMVLYGNDILFDASLHIVGFSFLLYLLYFQINKEYRYVYFGFCLIVLLIVGIHRIINYEHNQIGLILGLLISLVAIYFSHKN